MFTKVDSININEIPKNAKVIDVRETHEVAQRKFKNSKNIPLTGVLLNTDSHFNKEETYYIICASGMRSKKATKHLVKNGYNAININGGIMSWDGK